MSKRAPLVLSLCAIGMLAACASVPMPDTAHGPNGERLPDVCYQWTFRGTYGLTGLTTRSSRQPVGAGVGSARLAMSAWAASAPMRMAPCMLG